MKKVLFVISSLGKGGAERALSNLTLNFPPDWQIDILLNSDKIIEYPYRGNILTLGMNGKPKMDSFIYHFRLLFKRIFVLRKLKRQNDYCACISFLDSANIANILSGNKYCKSIISVRASLIEQSKRPKYKLVLNSLVKIFYHHADKIVAVSEGIKDELICYYKLSADSVIAIRNGYNVQDIRRKSCEALREDEQLLFESDKVIVTVGRLTEQKAQWHLIRAFSEVIRHEAKAKLLIFGTGHLEKQLKQLVEELFSEDNEERVVFKGVADNPYQYISRACLFVLPSLYEGFPNTLAEAVCLGAPCVATDFKTGAREILAPDMNVQGETIKEIKEVQYGILTPVCSGMQYDARAPLEYQEECLAKTILLLLQDDKKREEYAEKSLLRSEDLGIDNIVQKWITVIEE